jgi:hypothetical protein
MVGKFAGYQRRSSIMAHLTDSHIESFSVSAIRAAEYLDACDNGEVGLPLNARYYQACGKVLRELFALLDPEQHFPVLLERSPAAREIAESMVIDRHLRVSALGYYPELTATLNRAAR